MYKIRGNLYQRIQEVTQCYSIGTMSSTCIKTFVAFFVLTQIGLAAYFIWDAATDWENSPSVTSVSVKRVQSYAFPAVTLCYPNTWKWPALIKILSKKVVKGSQNWSFLDELNVDMGLEKIVDYRLLSSSWGYHKMTKNGTIVHYCRLANHFFRNQKFTEERKFLKWIFNYIGNLKDKTTRNDVDHSADGKIYKILKKYTLKKKLTKNVVGKIKKEICDLGFVNCTLIDSQQCMKADLGLQVFRWIHEFWINQRYNNTETMLQMMQKKFFHEKFERIDWESDTAKTKLYLVNKYVYKELGFNPFFAWHLLNGIFVSKDDWFGKFLANKWNFSLRELWESGISNTTGLVDEEYMCYGNTTCEPTINQLEKSKSNTLEKIREMMQEPKVHGNMEDDDHFVLIPMCSFGNSTLTDCKYFSASKGSYQDDTCFTFDPRDDPNKDKMVLADKEDGLHLALNIQDIPRDYGQDLRLKLFLHEPGTFPDVLTLDSNYLEIIPNQETNVAIDNIISEEVTENFIEMDARKRQCWLTPTNDIVNSPNRKDNMKDIKSKRTHCLIKHIYEFALKKCQCLPWTMNMTDHQIISDFPRCDITGSICFRDAVTEGKLEFGPQNCPYNCVQKHYKASITTSDYNRALLYGEHYMDFLANNPTGILTSTEKIKRWEENYDIEDYVKIAGETFSIFHIFLDKPEVTVITKDAKVTLPDMISNIGGTVGIFLGLSTLSVLDLLIDWCQWAKKSMSFNKK